MKNAEDVEKLEKLAGQLQGLPSEIGALAKKSPNDAVNPFKLKLINRVLELGNEILVGRYRPFEEFERFDPDDVPSNSDVTLIVAQYMEQTERFRSDNVTYHDYTWVYLLGGKPSKIKAAPRRKGD